jgi:hypothetical protein
MTKVNLRIMNAPNRVNYNEGDDFEIMHVEDREVELVSLGKIVKRYEVKSSKGINHHYITLLARLKHEGFRSSRVYRNFRLAGGHVKLADRQEEL